MKKYVVDNEKRTITATWEKLSPKDQKSVKALQDLGYTFVEKIQTRGGAKRNRGYYDSNLVNEDKEIFASIEAKQTYQKAVSFASMIIKLGKFTDDKEEQEEVLDTFRGLAVNDLVAAKLYFNDVMKAA